MVALCRDVFISKLRKFRLSFAVFQYSNPYFPYVFHYPLQIFHICEKNSRDCGSSLYFYLYFFFLIFVCIKGHPSSDSGPSKEISWKESKLKSIIAACGKIHGAYCCFDHWTVKNQVHLYENFPRNCCFSRYFQNIHTTSVPSSLLFLL